ncbi:ABC transporter permease [Aeromicrobium stalagmiti]|uniref:ABC transporter permease n=1 Tax=Aeromicrobium stalagmiti TaxID=2738988 RepID=UPI00156801BF|nr:ABC transporter permease [Aeromicrobium stalagmiti]NRQ50283.1 ABC transporter permease subunit [Aeromicrobium stalagmiti]
MSTAAPITIDTARPGVPLGRLIKVELRKMFNTRSGFWLMLSIAIVAAIATVAIIIFADGDDLSFGLFAQGIGIPMAIVLPVIAILSVTSEWSQRTGLITFTLVPHRGSIIAAKAIAAIIVGIAGMLIAYAIGALGNIGGSAIAGVDPVWDTSLVNLVTIILANVLGLLIGFTLGVLIRNSAGAIVGYFVYSFVIPSILGFLAFSQDWFEKLQPWIDFNDATLPLFDGGPSGEEWAQIGTSGLIWLVIPMTFGIWAVLKSEVK